MGNKDACVDATEFLLHSKGAHKKPMKIKQSIWLAHLRGIGSPFLLALVLAVGAGVARGQTYSVLYSFQCPPDGGVPQAGLAQDKAGNLYGTTEFGGTGSCNIGTVPGCGTAFELTVSGSETVLHSFGVNPGDGQYPQASLALDSVGNLYGVTDEGGTYSNGTVFKVTPTGEETVLLNFTGGLEGATPQGGLVWDSSGNLYGTTQAGGGWNVGIVFKLNSSDREMPLHDFNGGTTDGASPSDGLIQDSTGILYSTTSEGGENNAGTVFEMSLGGTETLLHSFLGPPTDGAYPSGGRLLRDTGGNLYGATVGGGLYGNGTVFKLTPSRAETVLLSFPGSKLGATPLDGLAEDKAGNLYGTALSGGSAQCNEGGGCGVLFKLSPSGKEVVLHNFEGAPTDGQSPNGGLIRDFAGNLYGTTQEGGAHGCGTVFKMTP
jgi:uncharacterized repeat protein (TIGR03803 family)